MLKRQLFFLAILAAPAVGFAFRTPLALLALPLCAVAAWVCASPVTWPAWLARGLVRAVPAAGLLTLALWLLTR